MFYDVATAIVKIIFKICFKVEVNGVENIPTDKPFILAVNHKSNWDPPAAALYCPRHLRFMAKEELFKNPIFGRLITKLGAFPISRGRGDLGAIKGAFSILKNNEVLLMFPQGHRMKNGERGKAQPGVAMIAHKMQVPVVPLCISGEYKFRRKIKITYGELIEFSEYYGTKPDSKQLQAMADEVLDKILINDTEGKKIEA